MHITDVHGTVCGLYLSILLYHGNQRNCFNAPRQGAHERHVCCLLNQTRHARARLLAIFARIKTLVLNGQNNR
jgi:hypothetical protein